MSMGALLHATVDRIRTLGYSPEQCGVQPDGEPDPVAGEVYVSVYPLGIRNTDEGAHRLEEEYEVGVAVTLRAGSMPVDAFGPAGVTRATSGLYARAEAIRARLHMDYGVLDLVGGVCGTASWTGGRPYSLPATAQGFAEPLRFRTCSAVRLKGPDWFSAEGDADPPGGLVVEMVFAGARRIQTLESQA